MALPTENDLANRLFEVGRARADQQGLEIEPNATGLLLNFATNGAKTILAAAGQKPNDAQDAFVRGAIRVATESMVTFVDEMASARFRIQGYLASHPTSMGEDTFEQAKKFLCPLWPFC